MSKKATPKKSTQPIIISLSVILLLSLALNLWLIMHPLTVPGSTTQLSTSSKPKCLEYGYINKEDFLAHYKVGSQETLQSIATAQLHDSSRAHEILLLNQAQLEPISDLPLTPFNESSILPSGKTLLLPPLEARFTSANITGVQGVITKTDGNQILVSPEPGLNLALYTDSDTKLERNFKAGDCIKAIYYDDGSNKAVWISLQT